jgi:carboxyl-terminal processing protease
MGASVSHQGQSMWVMGRSSVRLAATVAVDPMGPRLVGGRDSLRGTMCPHDPEKTMQPWTAQPSTRRLTPARRAGRVGAGLILLLIGALVGLWVGSTGTPAAAAADPSAIPGATGLPIGFATYEEALGIVRDHFVDPSALTDERLVQGSIRGLVDALGDAGHTRYLTPQQYLAEQQALDGTLTGIGVVLDQRSGTPLIISVIDGSPADRAGLRSGDLIRTIDGQRTDRASVEELLERVRGEPGSTVELQVERRDGTRRAFSLVRERIDVPAASWSLVPGTRVAHVRLVQFSGGASDELGDALRQALEAEASAIVLDLRGNPGGLVSEALEVAGLFMTDEVVYIQESRDGGRLPIRTVGDPLVPDLPLAVLVDYGSASAAEIVASALRDAGRARLIGQQTYGTGTVLNVFPLSDGSAIRLGVQRWLTPEGELIYEAGITPDVVVPLPADGAPLEPDEVAALRPRGLASSGDTQLRRAVRWLDRAR